MADAEAEEIINLSTESGQAQQIAETQMDFEDGKRALAALIAKSPDTQDLSANEAATRFHLIDGLLTDVLGWPKSEISVERHAAGEYTDYELGDPKALLVEAKRAGLHFELPAGWTKPTAAMTTLLEQSPSFTEPLKQAIRYCQNRGIAYGALCNGHQIVAFVGSRRDGIEPLKGRVLVFSSLHDMNSRFTDLWAALSRAGVRECNLERVLRAEVLPPPPRKLSSRIAGYPGFKNRNHVAANLQILGGLFIEDLARAPELEVDFLSETYCQSGALSQYSLLSKELLRARYATFFEKESEVSATPAVNKDGISNELMHDIVAASLSRRPVLLVGDVGSGKSTFIRHLIRVEAKEELARSIVLYLDFGSKPTLANDLRTFVISEVVRQLLEHHSIDVYERNFVRGVYNQKLQQFAKGIYSDLKASQPLIFKQKEIEYLEKLTNNTEDHLLACLTHASKGQRRQVVLFLDNVDQRPFDFQEEVFLIAQSFATNWPLTAFVALRPETFSQSRQKGSLSGYQPRVFTIEPPRIDLVLKKRFAFARNQLVKHGRLPGMPTGFSLESDSLRNYLDLLVQTFERDGEIGEFVDNMCAGNVRRALDFVSAFIGSAHVDSRKILDIIRREGSYTIPLHEFLRAVLFADGEHYDPARSPLLNVFDISTDDASEHFLSLILLSYILRIGQSSGAEGYAEADKVHRFAQEQGYHPEQTRSCLQRCVDKHLLSTPVGLTSTCTARYRVTTAGAYVVKKLVTLFAYLDPITVDTPIVDAKARDGITDVRAIQDRLSRAALFLDYLDDCWEHRSAHVSEVFDWGTVSASLRKDIARIQERV